MFHILERGVRDFENVQVHQQTPSSATQVEHGDNSSFEGVWMSSSAPHCCVYSGASFCHLRAHAQGFSCQEHSREDQNSFVCIAAPMQRWK